MERNDTETLDQFIEYINSKIEIANIKCPVPVTIAEILDAPIDVRYGWDQQKCVQNSIELLKYCLTLRRLISTNNNRLRWLKAKLDFMHGKYAPTTGVVSTSGENYTPYPMRIKILEAENEKCSYLKLRILQCESENEEYNCTAEFIRDLGFGLKELAKSKQ